ncbi:MAG: branched-chain amino acid ABC transporter substrate-binding protein, partial [Chloroflexi bacterium]
MFQSTRVMRLLVVLFLLLPFVGACRSEPPPPAEVTIGAIYPLSGSLEATGADLRRGVELAAEVINGEFDLEMPLAKTAGLPNLGGAKVKVVYADHAGDPDRGAEAARRLIEEEKVVALVGCYNSSVTAPASQVAETAGVPFLNPDSTSPTLTQRGFRWFFRTTADDAIFVRNFFDFLADLQQKQGITLGSVAIVYENTLFGTGVGQLERQYAQEAGLDVVADIPYSAKATNVEAEVRQIVASGASLVMQSSYAQDAILYMQTYKAMGYRPQAILAMDAGFISPAFIQTLGDDANYILSREVWASDLGEARPLVRQVNALFRERYGTDMTGNS